MDSLLVVKIGGNIIKDEVKLNNFLLQFSKIKGNKILIHGGGFLATKLANQLGIKQNIVEGRRITDLETLNIVTKIYTDINKNIVSTLRSLNCNALGICGTNTSIIESKKRNHPTINYGFVADISHVNSKQIDIFLKQNISLVIAPVTQDKAGQLLNTNADTIANEISVEMSKLYNVNLIYSFEKKGVLLNIDDDNSIIPSLNKAYYNKLKFDGNIFSGMIPKLDNSFEAIKKGVNKIIIGNAEELDNLINDKSGTTILND